MNFDPNTLDQLARLRAKAAEYRVLVVETELLAKRQPEFFAQEKLARKELPKLSCCEIIEFTEAAQSVQHGLDRLEFQLSCLTARKRHIESVLTRTKYEMEAEIANLINLLSKSAHEQWEAQARAEIKNVRGDTIADKVDALLAVCRKLGAALPTDKEVSEVTV